MAVFYTTVEESEQSFLRPSIVQIAKQLMRNIGLDEDTKMIYLGDSGINKQQGAGVTDSNNDVRVESTRLITIESDVDFLENTTFNVAVNSDENPPVIMDQDIGLFIRPIYTQAKVVLTITYRTMSKTEATRFRDDMRVAISHLRNVYLHDVTYHYPIHAKILELVSECWTRKIAKRADTPELAQYLSTNSSGRATIISTLVGTHPTLVIGETQKRIVGHFDMSEFPDKPDYNHDKQTYEIKLTYNFTIDKPTAVSVRYPIMVYNQLMPKILIDEYTNAPDPNDTPSSYSHSLAAFSMFERDMIKYHYSDLNRYYKLPEYDDYLLPTTPPYTLTIFTALLELDDGNIQACFNLGDLGDIVIDKDVLGFMLTSEASFMVKPQQSIFLLHVYSNDRPIQFDALQVNINGDVTFTITPSIKNCYRVRLSLYGDLSVLSREALRRLERNPIPGIKILSNINSLIRNNPNMDMELITRTIDKLVPDADLTIVRGLMLGYVIAMKRSELVDEGTNIHQLASEGMTLT